MGGGLLPLLLVTDFCRRVFPPLCPPVPPPPPPPPPDPPHDAAVRTVTTLRATTMAMSFFIVFVSPVTLMLMGCVDLFSTEAGEEAPGGRREHHLPDGMVNVVTSSIMAG